MKRPLYVTDLDGTLMRSDKSVSEDSVRIINQLISEGMCFTIATARTIRSASKIIKDIDFTVPVITLNGTVIADPKTEKTVEAALFSDNEINILREVLNGRAGNMIAKGFFDDGMHKTYLDHGFNPGFVTYLDEHKADKRLVGVKTEDELFAGDICYFSLIGPKEDLEDIYEEVKDSDTCETIFQKDTYLSDYWLEIFPKGSSKAEAIMKLKKMSGCDGIVVFGDSINDMSGFKIADECYAVANASDDLKEAATGVILSNDEDAVATWLKDNAIIG